jgi:hypothetical protein
MSNNLWLNEKVVRLFGKERLEQWKDRIAVYWEETIDGIDQEQLFHALARLYGKKEGRKLLRASRSDQVKAIVDGEGRWLVSQFVKKIEGVVRGPEDRLETAGLRLEEHPYSEADIVHEGTTTHYKVDGIICITGGVSVYHPDGTTHEVTVFSKWVSHPFWQYSHHDK